MKCEKSVEAFTEYKRAVVTFIDILGFKKLIQTKSPSEVNRLLKIFQYHSSNESYKSRTNIVSHDGSNEIYISPDINLMSFSDSIVRVAYPVMIKGFSEICDFDALCREVVSLVHIQESLLCEGVLIRGGLTIGDIFLDSNNNTLFGPAMNRAYLLESTTARVPRIIIDPQITYDTSPLNQIDSLTLSSMLHIDDELLVSIEYFGKYAAMNLLESLCKNDGQIDDSNLSDYSQHFEKEFLKLENKKRVIIKGLQESKHNKDEKVYQKYLWMAKMLNDSVEKFFMVFENFFQKGHSKSLLFSPKEKISYKVPMGFQDFGVNFDRYFEKELDWYFHL